MRKICFLIVIINACLVYSQDIKVKKFEPDVKDQTAALSPRKDINGIVCGLAKVQLIED